jgi:competence CoiA-like predicted nuclease
MSEGEGFMKYANLNNKRIEPQKGISDATCPVCGEVVIPKCGEIRMHHWAHKTKQNCDPWWESETEWHREWKNCFSKEFQEIIMYDNETGEKHVADVKTKTGFVIEFQHSAMKREEQVSREDFYKNMVWVVDAREYYETFKEHIDVLKKSENHKGYFYFRAFNSCFPQRWLESSVPVIFDFGLHSCSEDVNDKQKKWLYCIFPEKFEYCGTVCCCMYITKEDFIKKVSNSRSFFRNLILPELERKRLERIKALQEEKRKMEEEYRKRKETIFQEKYPRQKKWREAIFEVQERMKNNTLNPVKLHISRKGEIIDHNNRIYNEEKCMVISIKSYPAENKEGIKYTYNDALLLIESKSKIIFATAYISTYMINTLVYCRDLYFSGDRWWNRRVRTIKTTEYHNKFQLSFGDFEYDESLYCTRKIRESLEYIHNKFSNDSYNI